MKTRILNLVVALLLTITIGAKAQTEPEIIWHTPNVEASSLILSPDEQFVYANGRDASLANVFTQLRVDDGTIVRKDVKTIGHIGGFSVDGRYVFAINLRISNKIYKADAETFEKVDSLVFPSNILADGHFTSYAMSYDRKYLYLGAFGNNEPKVYDNFFVVDTETMEIIHSESYLATVASYPILSAGEILGIYPSPNNDYVALYVDVLTYDDIRAWLPVVDVRDNFKTVNSSLQFGGGISATFSLEGQKLFLVEEAKPNSFIRIYNTMNFTPIGQIPYQNNADLSERLGKVEASKVNNSLIFVGSSLIKEKQILQLTKITKLNIQTLKEECYLESFPDDEFIIGISRYLLFDNDRYFLAITSIGSIVKFKNCTTSTGVNDNKQEAKILQVIDNKLTILIDAKKGINLNYQISDIRGVMVTQKSMVSPSNELIIDVHHLVPGTYFLTLQIGKEIVNYKFIILR